MINIIKKILKLYIFYFENILNLDNHYLNIKISKC